MYTYNLDRRIKRWIRYNFLFNLISRVYPWTDAHTLRYTLCRCIRRGVARQWVILYCGTAWIFIQDRRKRFSTFIYSRRPNWSKLSVISFRLTFHTTRMNIGRWVSPWRINVKARGSRARVQRRCGRLSVNLRLILQSLSHNCESSICWYRLLNRT